MKASEADIARVLSILDADMTRKAPKTKTAYRRFTRDFLTRANDFSRPGIISYMNYLSDNYSKNTARLGYAAIAYLCKALEIKFPLDSRDLPPLPSEDEISAPAMPKADIEQLIKYWRERPGEYLTSLVFISSTFGVRAGELSDIAFGSGIIKVSIEKRKAKVIREHFIPVGTRQFLEGYHQSPLGTVKGTFRIICRDAGVKKPEGGAFHSIRRTLNTQLVLAGMPDPVIRRFMRWKPKMGDMVSVYFHMPYDQVDDMVFKVHPFLKTWRGE